jgi:hypothetical protein
MSTKKTSACPEELNRMNEPSRQAHQLYEERSRQLSDWEEWNRQAVIELGESLHHDPPELLLEDPRVGLVQLDALIRDEDMERISRESAVWVESRLHAFVALYLIVKFDGHWLVDGDPASATFGKYLVSVSSPENDSPVHIDVADRVHNFLHSPPLRSLTSLIIDIETFIVSQ